jgi:hypothetical protein
MIKNIFSQEISEEVIGRIEKLSPTSTPKWGKMTVDQMLAHCNVTYNYTYHSEKFTPPNVLKRMLLKALVKPMVVGEKTYPKNGKTATEFKMVGKKDFEREKSYLIENIRKTQKLGTTHFDGLDNFSFGKLTINEWNNLFYKHLDHHLTQFGV